MLKLSIFVMSGLVFTLGMSAKATAAEGQRAIIKETKHLVSIGRCYLPTNDPNEYSVNVEYRVITKFVIAKAVLGLTGVTDIKVAPGSLQTERTVVIEPKKFPAGPTRFGIQLLRPEDSKIECENFVAQKREELKLGLK